MPDEWFGGVDAEANEEAADRAYIAGRNEGRTEERARIRRELIAELMWQQGKMPLWVFDDLVKSVESVCRRPT